MAAKDLKDFVVAIELGSSKITGIAGKKNSDGSITVLAYAREDSSTFMKRGMVYNIDKTAQCLSTIKQKLENALKATIGKAYIGISGQSLRSVRNCVSQPLAPETIISKELVEELLNTNLTSSYADQEILHVIPQEYKLGTNYQIDPIGVMSDSIEGHYLNIIARTSLRSNIEKCLNQAGIQAAGYFIAPIALADCVLTDAEKRSGCALVDFGAGTTTVVVYKNNVLRHLAVIPLGGNNITKDISGQQIEEEDAEELKLKYGSAFNEYEDNEDVDKYFPVTNEQRIEVHQLNDIVESRIEEILANVLEQIKQSNCINELMAGMIITGGGSNLKNMELAISKRTEIEKIRVAKFVQQTINAKNPDINSKDGALNTTLSVLIKGKDNCFGNSLESNDGLFGPDGESLTDRIAAEKIRQEEENKKEQERLEEEARKEKLQKEKEQEELIKRQNSFWNKFKTKVKNLGEDLLNEDN